MKTDTNSKKWIVVYTKPKHEKTVKNELIKNNIEVYLPTLKERRKWSDRKKWVEFPLFRSYLFVKTKPRNAIFIVKTCGVIKIIKFGENIAIVKEKDILAIKRMIEGGYVPRTENYFIKGNAVVVNDGPLKGLVGEVIHAVNEKDRLIIRIEAIQQSISVKIDRGLLKLISNN